MIAIQQSDLRFIVHAAGVPESHSVNELLLDAAIEDAAQGGIEGTERLLSRTDGRRMTRSELERARQRADDVGRAGEELIDGYFDAQQISRAISNYQWSSAENAISPYDFRVHFDGATTIKVEVKSTASDFGQVIHISIAELREMATSQERYDLYRVYSLDERRGNLRIAEDVKSFAESLLTRIESLPYGATVDSLSVRPDRLNFGPEIAIDLRESDEPPEEEASLQAD